MSAWSNLSPIVDFERSNSEIRDDISMDEPSKDQPSYNGYQLIKMVGKGAYGTTYEAVNMRTGNKVAIKTIKNKNKYDYNIDQGIIDEIETLIRLQSRGCHKFIVCYYEYFISYIDDVEHAFIVTEYIDGSPLSDYVYKGDWRLIQSREIMIPLIYQLLLGCHHIHSNGFAHQDIKPDNIMFSLSKTIKFIDFGLSCMQECLWQDCQNTCSRNVGALTYSPPEYFRSGYRVKSLQDAQRHDIWSLAIVIWKLTNTRLYPFDKYNDQSKLRQSIMIAPIYGADYMYDFEDKSISKWIDSLLINDPNLRPTITDALQTYADQVLTKIP
jgi:serine/threonine protein kinase